MKTRILLLSIATAQSLYAMNVDKHNFYTRDYLDFGQNLGQFTPGSKNLSIIKKDGTEVALPNLPFPDFSKFNGSNRTSVGGAYTASAKHIVHPQNRPPQLNLNIKIGDSTYSDKQIKTYANDSAYTRTNKFIVEGGYKVTSFRELKQNAQDYTTHYKDEDRIVIYRSGNGRMSFEHWDGGPNAPESVKSSTKAGNLFYIKPSDIGDNQLVVRPNGNHYGPLKGVINTGDSGSPIFVFNNKTKEWEIVGTTHGATQGGQKVANTFWAVVDPNQLNSFKQQFEIEKIANDGSYIGEKDKDNVYKNSGTIRIDSKIDQGIGGIILRGADKTLTITGSGSFAGAGIDIDEENSKVVWDTGVSGDLHKIGKGELEVSHQTNGNLRMGEGVVRLKAENSFNSVYLGNREGKLILDNQNAMQDFNQISFSKSGGSVDLNGHSISMSGIKAYNASALITNENENKVSTLTLNNANKTIIHAKLEGNINIQASAAHTSVSVANANNDDRAVIFDGGFEIQTLSGSNQHIVLQGKPVPHATWEGGCSAPLPFLPQECKVGHYINKYDKPKAEQMGQGHKVVNQTVTFNQPDWIQRGYKGNIILTNNSKLFIERNADVRGDITLNNSSFSLNSKTLYIDSSDSKSLSQSIQSQSLSADVKDTITYEGALKASANSTITSQGIKSFSASIDLDNSTLTANNDEIKLLEKGLKLQNQASLTVNALHIKDKTSSIWIDKDSSLTIETLKLDNSTVALNTQNENLGKTINVNSSTLNVADGSKIPQNVNLTNSTLAFDNLNSTFSLNGSKFDDTSRLRAKNLSHKQNNNIAWKTNGIKHIDITEALKLSDVGSGEGDDKFLALKLEDTEINFLSGGRVLVSFTHNYLDDGTVDTERVYDMILLKKLTAQEDLLVSFEGQDSNTKMQALATKTDTGIKLSFTKDNQVNADDIMNAIGNRGNHQQLLLLNDLITTNPNHPLVLDVAFNRNNTSAINRIVERIQSIDDDAKKISKTMMSNSNLQLINHHNKVTSKRINTIKAANMSANNEIGSYLYASLVSDVPLVYPMDENHLVNNMWINAGGGYFDGNGQLKYFSTNIGYDRQFSFDENDVILGTLLSFGRSYADNGAYNDHVSNYGFGVYGALNHEMHELQANSNYVIGKSKKYNYLATDQMTDYGFGVSTLYKYAFKLDEHQALKPIFGLEYVFNKMSGYTLDIMRIGAYNYHALSGVLGAEYAYSDEKLFLSTALSGEKAIHRTNDKIRVGIDGSHRFIGYDLQNDRLIYHLDVMANYKINKSFVLGANVNFQTTLRGESGVGGLLKSEYRF
ncbi:S6 family peptidase [Campylobacter vulpis]|uniref:S6 family peptidase n=1 Tax=Campylobacter vulpis TaxID=1655500 RepID=UPI001BCC7787|nr:S6 family peptidase [Campylobacter vulpis]MBS4251782.1 autotransporter domain-containing protein [Campylobacter vulpis]